MFNHNNNDRGQVGIGTLIVFIAMVLVAAIAAGVLINTAGLLQSQAEATGQESSEQVTDRVQVTTVTGESQPFTDADLSTADDRIETLRLTVSRSPGAGNINLENAIIEVFANGYSGTLTHSSTTDESTPESPPSPNAGDIFNINMIDGGTAGVLADSSNRAQLIFRLSELDPADINTGNTANTGARSTLAPGDSVTITITTAQGGTAFIEKRAPSTVSGTNIYRL